ncbi:MAG: hypothetical protein ACI4KR_04390 [Ruminiclostridium sp.]
MMSFIFFTVMIVLHFCKKQRFSALWVMILTCLLLANDIWNIFVIFDPGMPFYYYFGVIPALEGLFIFGYQNIFPSDNLSFKRFYTERAKRLIGARRLIITGICGTIAGIFCSVLGIALMSLIGISFFGMDRETFAAVTTATAGLKFIFGIVGAMAAILIAVFGLGAFVLGDIMLTNGLIRGLLSLYGNSGGRTALILLSCLPAANIFYSFFCLRATKLAIKAEEQVTQYFQKGE